MPYRTIKDLPSRVKNKLPKHAQEVFRRTFESALHEYGNEKTAFKVAWSAAGKVKKKGTRKLKKNKSFREVVRNQ